MDYLQYLIAMIMILSRFSQVVLNLIINGLPSILSKGVFTYPLSDVVLNLIINGLPSIPRNVQGVFSESVNDSFKPYYKWITFNTIL